MTRSRFDALSRRRFRWSAPRVYTAGVDANCDTDGFPTHDETETSSGATIR